MGLSSIRLRMLLIEVSKELLLSKIVCDVKLRTETRLSKLSLVYGPPICAVLTQFSCGTCKAKFEVKGVKYVC